MRAAAGAFFPLAPFGLTKLSCGVLGFAAGVSGPAFFPALRRVELLLVGLLIVTMKGLLERVRVRIFKYKGWMGENNLDGEGDSDSDSDSEYAGYYIV